MPTLLPMVESVPHRTFVELFAGGAALTAAKAPSKVEAINDIHGDLVNLYRCAKWHFPALLDELDWTFHSREQHAEFRHDAGSTDIQRAARWFWRCYLGGGFGPDSYGRSKFAPPPTREHRLRCLREFSARLQTVYVERLDWSRCIELYDSPETLFFADPPYQDCPGTGYGGWGPEQIAQFAARIQTVQGSWIVTLNDSPEVRAAFQGCDIQTADRAKGVGARDGGRRAEVIVRARR